MEHQRRLQESRLDHSSVNDNRQLVDERRNLYVLGVPQHFTLEQLRTLFEPLGCVLHAVILAVLDAFSRRRGFVVMSTNQEAVNAMKRLSGKVIQGHKLHISWAVVQRSNGFLDGTDRASFSRNISVPRPLLHEIPSANHSPSHELPTFAPANPVAASFDGVEKFLSQPKLLLLLNLHRTLFTSPSDLLPLVLPYGAIGIVQLIDPASTTNAPDTFWSPSASSDYLAALIRFVRSDDALTACKALDGQAYNVGNDHPLRCFLVGSHATHSLAAE